jgi:hypothetical protein
MDVHFFKVAIDPQNSETHKDSFRELIKPYVTGKEEVNYIELGAALDSQHRALIVFAIGAYLKLWELMTPKRFKIKEPLASEMAGLGFVSIVNIEV